MYEGFLSWELNYAEAGLWGRFLYSVPFMLGSFVGAFLYAKSLKKRRLFWLRSIFCLGVGLAIAYLIWDLYSPPAYAYIVALLKYIVLFGLVYASMLLCFRCTWVEALFFSETGVASFSIVKNLFDLIGIVNLNYSWGIKPYGVVYSLIYLFLLIIVYALLYVFFCRELDFSSVFFYERKKIFLPTLSILLISTFFNIMIGSMSLKYHLPYDVLALLKGSLLICCLFVVFFNFDTFQIGKQKYEMEVIEQLSRQQLEQFRVSKETIENVNMKYHDLKGQVLSLERIAGKEGGSLSLDSVKEEIRRYETIVRTGNDALDVILTEKNTYCEQNGIVLNCMADGEKLFFLETIDIVSLFGNILSNAIEAVRGISEKGKRLVTLSVTTRGNLLLIESENYCERQLVFKNGFPQTDKEDKTSHGYGLKSIRFVAKKYGGTVSVGMEHSVFRVGVVLPVPCET